LRPLSWGGQFGIGCYACNATKQNSQFGRIAVNTLNMMQPCCFYNHEKTKQHVAAVIALDRTPEATSAGQPVNSGANSGAVGLTSGLGEDVPRLDRWVQIGEVLADRGSLHDFQRHAHGSVVGSGLGVTGHRSDRSPQTAEHLIDCMGWRLQQRTQQVMRQVRKTGIALDSLPAL
jgi:hypothetical protein